jgi:uncharacterized BrkB/YihY/UPF0761 family membrane protein
LKSCLSDPYAETKCRSQALLRGEILLAIRASGHWTAPHYKHGADHGSIIYNDVYDEHLFVFAAGLSYYLVLSLFPLLVSMAALLAYVPIPHLFEGLLSLMARLVPGDGMSLVRNIVSDVITHKHTHFLTLGLVFTIWTVSSGFAAIIDGLDAVYRVRETLAQSGKLDPLHWG